MLKYSGIICDMDGTLLDSEIQYIDTFQESLKYFNLPDLTEGYKRCIGVNRVEGEKILRETLDGYIDFDKFTKYWGELHKESLQHPIPLKKGAIEFFERAKLLGYPLAIATSTGKEKALEDLERSKIIQYFDIVTGGDEIGRSKPAPDIFLKSAERLGVDSSSSLALEDSPNGVKSALAADMFVVHIPDIVEVEPFQNDKYRVVDNLLEAVDLI